MGAKDKFAVYYQRGPYDFVVIAPGKRQLEISRCAVDENSLKIGYPKLNLVKCEPIEDKISAETKKYYGNGKDIIEKLKQDKLL